MVNEQCRDTMAAMPSAGGFETGFERARPFAECGAEPHETIRV